MPAPTLAQAPTQTPTQAPAQADEAPSAAPEQSPAQTAAGQPPGDAKAVRPRHAAAETPAKQAGRKQENEAGDPAAMLAAMQAASPQAPPVPSAPPADPAGEISPAGQRGTASPIAPAATAAPNNVQIGASDTVQTVPTPKILSSADGNADATVTGPAQAAAAATGDASLSAGDDEDAQPGPAASGDVRPAPRKISMADTGKTPARPATGKPNGVQAANAANGDAQTGTQTGAQTSTQTSTKAAAQDDAQAKTPAPPGPGADTATQPAAHAAPPQAASLLAAAPAAQPALQPAAPPHGALTHVTVTAQPPNLHALAVDIAARSQGGARQFDIRLDPPEMGRVDVRLSIDSTGKASAHLTADQPQTLDLLQKDAPELTRALRDAGLDVSQNGLNFSLRQQQHQGGNAFMGGEQGGGRQPPRGSMPLHAASQNFDAAGIAAAYRARPDGRVDIRV